MNDEQKQIRREFAKKQWAERRNNPKLYYEICKKISNSKGDNKTVFKCLECGKEIKDWRERKFCDLICAHKNINYREEQRKAKLKSPINYWLGKKRPEIRNFQQFDRTGIIPWNKDKQCPQLAKEKHWNWQGGKSKERHSFYFKNVLSRYLRENYTCLVCKTKDDLVVHHSDLNKLNNKMSNMLVLCRPHHAQFHHLINTLIKW
jgi:hypothetical protein